jgi:hypothetical protein
LEKLRLHGNKFTWTNKQKSPLLERLDWFFASISWMANYPSSSTFILSRDISNHTPCLISISTYIPKSKVFRFEIFWLLHEEFMSVLQHGWNVSDLMQDMAKDLGAKFKNLSRVLIAWQSQLANLAK